MALPQRRVPSPITNLPVNALTDDLDPTREIRSLIEQLQQSARDARNQTRTVEHERDDLATQLEQTLNQIEQLRANEREFRAQFVEITSLIRERDNALIEAERGKKSTTDLQRKLEVAGRERNDAQRQRDDAVRQREETVKRQAEAAKASQEALAQLGDVQKQIINIRQARDAAQALNMDLSNKMARAEDEMAEMSWQKEAAQKAQKKQQDELAELRRQVGIVTGDRDATAQQVLDLNEQLDESRKKLLDLAEQKSAVLESDTQHANALAEARQQVLDITIERDAARLRAQDQAKELEDLRQQVTQMRELEAAAVVPPEQLDELKRQMASLIAERDRHEAHELQLVQETSAQQERLSQLTGQLTAAERSHEEAFTALQAAQKQIDDILRERDELKERAVDGTLETEAQIAALRMQAEALENDTAQAERRVQELMPKLEAARELGERFEQQRVETIDLGARLEAAQREILELSANLAEARLAAKCANSRAAKEAAAAVKIALAPSVQSMEMNLNSPTEPSTDERQAPPVVEILEPLNDKQARSALGAMKHCFQSFQKNPEDRSLLNELYSHAYGFSERARVSGFVGLYRLGSSFAHLTRELYEYPELVNSSSLRTVSQTIDFLSALVKDRVLAQIKDPSKALVYAVDDDAENCSAIQMAMETAGLRTSTAQEPAVALAEIAASRFDLIFLDVNLPGMDGFELCAHIRDLALHVKTPVVFLTGLNTLENRVQSSLSGASDFVGKPFNLHELSVKALTLILKTQLKMD